MGLTDVWDDVNFYEEKDRIHPTQKPQKLLARLILASSDEDDISKLETTAPQALQDPN